MDRIDQILAVVEETNRRLTSLDTKVSGLDTKVSSLDAKFSGKISELDAKISGLDMKFSGLDAKVSGLDARTAGMEEQISGIAEQVAGLSEWRTTTDQQSVRAFGLLLDTRDRVERLETGFSEVKAWKEETLNKLDGFLVILDRHETEIAAFSSESSTRRGSAQS